MLTCDTRAFYVLRQVLYSDGAKARPALARAHGHAAVSVKHGLQECTRKVPGKPRVGASAIAGTQKADSNWKSMKKWIPTSLCNTGMKSRKVNPEILSYIRSWQWRILDRVNCMTHFCKALQKKS